MHKIIKEGCSEGESRFQPYCFPNIPMESDQSRTKSVAGGSGFRRVEFDMNGRPVGPMKNLVMQGEQCHGEVENEKDIERKAYQQGFMKGEKEGIESGKKKIEPVLNNFQQALTELAKIRSELYLSAEKETVDLALAVARKIVGHVVDTNKDVVIKVVEEALRKTVTHDNIVVRVSPSDFQFVKSSRFQFYECVENFENIIFEEDESIRSGGCVIETNLGEIDARIDRQFQIVEEAFKSEIQGSRFNGQDA